MTGGGNGLGRAISIELAKNGCHVAIADVDLNGAERTAADIRQMGVKSKAYQVILLNDDSEKYFVNCEGKMYLKKIQISRSMSVNMKKCRICEIKSRKILALSIY